MNKTGFLRLAAVTILPWTVYWGYVSWDTNRDYNRQKTSLQHYSQPLDEVFIKLFDRNQDALQRVRNERAEMVLYLEQQIPNTREQAVQSLFYALYGALLPFVLALATLIGRWVYLGFQKPVIIKTEKE